MNQQIIVQSVDGALIVIDDEFIIFKISLSDYFIPGPIQYSATSKNVMLANSKLEIECYSYDSLKIFTNNNVIQQRLSMAGGEQNKEKDKIKIKPAWICNIGEQARHIQIHFNKYTQQSDVVVLGENSLFILNENSGSIRYQKRYNFSPACFLTYHLPVNGADIFVEDGEDKREVIDRADHDGLKTPGFMIMMGSFEGFLMVYRDTKLAWTTKLPGVPVFVAKASFQGLEGLIVSLDDTGLLSVSYLGTDKMSQADIGKLH
jgi:Bardet-Biedl syndrome 9 protein